MGERASLRHWESQNTVTNSTTHEQFQFQNRALIKLNYSNLRKVIAKYNFGGFTLHLSSRFHSK